MGGGTPTTLSVNQLEIMFSAIDKYLKNDKLINIENIKYTNMIEVVDYKNYNFTDEYVFMLGFNQGIIPNIFF